MPSARPHTRNRRGSALFLILLAVVLFAALYVAVTGSDRGNKDGSGESAEAAAAEILNTLTLLENGLQRFLLSNGYGIDNIDMSFPGTGPKYDSPLCTSGSCNLFHPSGGALNVSFPLKFRDMENATHWYPSDSTPLNVMFVMGKIPNLGTDKADIILKIKGINYQLCKQINALFGVKDKTQEINDTNSPKFTPNGLDDSYNYQSGTAANKGIGTWCLERNTKPYGSYLFHVILTR